MAIIYGKIHYHGEMAEDVIDLKEAAKNIIGYLLFCFLRKHD